jgi:hypothetical protein
MMLEYPLSERKLVYRILHRNLKDFPELMDTQFLTDLQTNLQQAAQAEGIDLSDHGQWDAWLGNAPGRCQIRVGRRDVIC